MSLNITIDLTGILENLLFDQKGKKQANSIRELRSLLTDLGAFKPFAKKSVLIKKKIKSHKKKNK